MSDDAKYLTVEEEAALGIDLGQADTTEESVMSVTDLEDDTQKNKKCKLRSVEQEDEPSMSDPEWSDFVMKHFTDGELDENGRPLVAGLRRVARLLLGPILESKARVVQPPSLLPGFERLSMLQPAVVEYTIKILMCRLEQGMDAAYPIEFTETADCYFGNVGDVEFGRYLTAMAATRAEGRALRKALQLSVIASEEKSVLPVAEAAVDGMIAPEQINFINSLCFRLDIDVLKYINSGKRKYARIEDVPYGVAAKMVEHLSSLQNNRENVPDNIRGYNKSWRSN